MVRVWVSPLLSMWFGVGIVILTEVVGAAAPVHVVRGGCCRSWFGVVVAGVGVGQPWGGTANLLRADTILAGVAGVCV